MSDECFRVNIRPPDPDQDPPPPPPPPGILRADDFLLLDFEFFNLRVSTPTPGKPVLTVVDRGKPAFVVVVFPPQNIAEQAFWLAADEPGKVFPVPPGQPPGPSVSVPLTSLAAS